MKLFIKKFSVFLLPVVLVFIILELLVRDSNSLYKAKWDGFITKADSIKVLVLGNSHALNGINPNEFDLFTYNMAFAAQSFYFDKKIVLKNMKNMNNLKYVLISIDYHTFYFPHSTGRDKFYHYYYNINYKDNNYTKEDISRVYTLGFKQTIREHIPKQPFNLFRGYGESKSTTQWELLNNKSAIARIKQLDLDISSRKEIIESMDDFINILKSNNITPILLTLPCHKYFIENINFEIEKQNKTDILYLKKKHNIIHLDFFKEKLPDSLFKDLDHLNSKGAVEISRKINNMIMNNSL